MTATGIDLGACIAHRPDGSPCPGRLIVQSESAGFLEAACDQCGCEAVCPPGARRRQEAEPVDSGPEPWWKDSP